MLYNILPKAERSDRGNSTCPRTKLRRDVGSQVCATDIEHDGVVGRLLAAEARSWSARKTAGWSTLVLRRRRRAEIRRRALWEFDPKVSAGVLRHQKYSREVWSRLHRRHRRRTHSPGSGDQGWGVIAEGMVSERRPVYRARLASAPAEVTAVAVLLNPL
jgi:hypothetical protein